MVSQSVRIRFRKVGKLQFISHLDLCRTMRSAVVRARLPVKYTEGFNPHIKMTFALPLSIGAQSEWEYMDLVLTEERTEAQILKALAPQLPSELAPLGVAAPQATYAQIGWAEYRITFAQGQTDAAAVEALLGKPVLLAKRTKHGGEKTVDITESIGRFKATDAPDGSVELVALLRADNAGYLNPEYVAKAVGVADYEILRTGVFLADATTPFA